MKEQKDGRGEKIGLSNPYGPLYKDRKQLSQYCAIHLLWQCRDGKEVTPSLPIIRVS
jgi:hypothetical protein